ncbi:MAG: 50S ribosomal protein L15 [Desulfobacteraceae bacterium]|nr:MAG: 50S ribosomal protein L15 [Desulfobacteraceae bacterium]
MKLSDLSPAKGAKTSRKRLGKGPGSGLGKTSGKGHKGHRARSGGGVRPGFEGGQMPIHRRLPKRGFTNIFKLVVSTINIKDLERFESGSVVDEALLYSSGLLKGKCDVIKLLGSGEINFPLTVKLNAASKSAISKIEAAGGKIEVLS